MTRTVSTGWLVLSVALGIVVVPGCDVFSEPGENGLREKMKQRVQDRRQQWQDQGIDNYQLLYKQKVAETVIDSVRVYVRQGAVDSIYASQNVPTDELLVGTVLSFFDLVEARIGEEESQFTADFDEERGYPRSYTADFQDGRASQTVLVLALQDSVEKVGTGQY